MAGNHDGFKVIDAVLSSSGAAATVYSNKFSTSNADIWSTHFTSTAVSGYSAAFTLWASNTEEPTTADDTDWVQMTADHGYDGLPSGDPVTASAFKELVDIGVSGARWYRWKIARTAGNATITARVHRKSRH